MATRLTAMALAGAALLVPEVAMTQEIELYLTGEKLNDHCRTYLTMRRNNSKVDSAEDAYSAGLCYGFVVGVVDLYSGLNGWNAISADRQPAFCTAGVNAHSAAEAVALYLDQHPMERHTAGFFLVRQILAEKFPC